ncbi:MAG: STAS domain-containing protein [Candidatus Anammoximicrobium sp.]|nr:STAS domain-containing protein [Candidatus Anammoximicrobium sp.]
MSLLASAAVNDVGESHGFDSPYRCCLCGHVLPYHPAFTADVNCPKCGSLLWCVRRDNGSEVVLEVVPGRTPSVEEIESLSRVLRTDEIVPRVIVDLSGLDLINSALVAMLVLLNKRIHAAAGTLRLSGLNEVVREIFFRFKLDSLFEIVEFKPAPPARCS